MTIIDRHLLSTFLRNLGNTLAGTLVLFTLMDLLDHMGSFVDNSASLSMVLRYYLYKSVWTIDTVLPIATLMAVLFTVGTMARYLEMTALFAVGRSLLQVCTPLIAVAFLLSLGSMAWREFVLPEANVRMHKVWEVEIHKNPDTINPTEHIAIRGPDDRKYYARKFDPESGILRGLKIITLDGSKVVERIDADRAEWNGKQWTLVGVVKREFRNQEEITTHFARLTATDLTIDPKGFYRDRIRQEDMNMRQLRDHAALVRESGGNPTSALVDIQFQLAFPWVNLIVALIGVVLASGPRKTTVASGFGLTLLVSFGYYMFMNFGKSFGHSGTVPPVLSAWAGNVFFLLLFLVLFLRARR